jgi:hypothetical protein
MTGRLPGDITAAGADDEKAAAAAAQGVRHLIVVSLLTAAASGFHSPYTIPDTVTAALGLLLAIAILATLGRMDHRHTTPKIPVCWTGDPECGQPRPAGRG